MKNLYKLKTFVFDALLTRENLTLLEKEGIYLDTSISDNTVERVVENSFSPRLWNNANKMAAVYKSIFCVENMLRDFIVERLSENHGIDWWNTTVPDKVKREVDKLKREEEKNKYYSNRSSSNIGYTMLGNLTQIIISNWDDFSDVIPNQAWIKSRMDDLEMSRNIIMHTGILPDIELDRVDSIVRDMIRQLS